MSRTGSLAKPAGEPCFVNPVRGHREDGFLCLFDVRWIGIPDNIVEIEEHHETCPAGSLVPVGQRMIPCQMTGEDCSLVDQIGVEVLISEAGLGRVQCRIGEVDAARVSQDLGIDPGDLFGEPEELR